MDLFSSNSCFREVVVGRSSSKIIVDRMYLLKGLRADIVIPSSSCGLDALVYNVFIKIINFALKFNTHSALESLCSHKTPVSYDL